MVTPAWQTPIDPAVPAAPGERSAENSATSIERRSSARSQSRGNKYRMSSPVIMNIVQASDLLLLLCSGVLAKAILSSLHEPLFDKSLFLATIAGSVVTAVFLTRADAYPPHSLRSLGKQLQLLPLPLLLGAGSAMACLFLMRDEGQVFRQWPFLWLLLSAVLLTAARCYLSRLLRTWIASGRLARRVAVIGAGRFSHEFIDRLRSEPHAYTVVGLYDVRLSRIPAI